MPYQSREVFYVCLCMGDREPCAGRDPRRDPRYDAAPWVLPRVNPLAAVGVVGWLATLGSWAGRRRAAMLADVSVSSRYRW